MVDDPLNDVGCGQNIPTVYHRELAKFLWLLQKKHMNINM